MAAATGTVGFYFVNGVANTNGSGSSATDQLQSILQSSKEYQAGKTYIAFQHNDAAPAGRLATEAALVAVAVGCLAYSTDAEMKNEGNEKTRLIGFVGLASLIALVIDYTKMQEEKNEIATSLAGRVEKFLKEDPSNVANLVLHSQGADVGFRALEKLSRYKGRIRVVTLGAMTTIPASLASDVKNFKFDTDWVSRVGTVLFEGSRRLTDPGERDIKLISSGDLSTHSVDKYLSNLKVKAALTDLLV